MVYNIKIPEKCYRNAADFEIISLKILGLL